MVSRFAKPKKLGQAKWMNENGYNCFYNYIKKNSFFKYIKPRMIVDFEISLVVKLMFLIKLAIYV